MELSSKERIELSLKGEEVDRPPFSPNLAYFWECQPESVQEHGMAAFLAEAGADPLWRGAPCPVRIETRDVEIRSEWRGNELFEETITPVGRLIARSVRSSSGNTVFLVDHPLKTEEDFKVRLWIEERISFLPDPEPVEKHREGDGKEGLSIGMLIPRLKTSFQHLVETLAGTQTLIYSLYDFPDTVRELHEAIMRNNLKAAEFAADLGWYDYFLTWEDSSTTNYSPALYEEFILPEIHGYAEILGKRGKKYIQHACGHLKDLFPLMNGSGIFAVESLSPKPTGNVTLKEARSALDLSIGIIGGIEPTMLKNLSIPELEPYVREVLEDAKGGAFVLANSDSCPPEVESEKFKVIADVVKRM
jgi:hypothetical protein